MMVMMRIIKDVGYWWFKSMKSPFNGSQNNMVIKWTPIFAQEVQSGSKTLL